MNKTQMIKRAYVRGLAARGIYRARLRQKQAAGGLKDYAISGGIGAAGGGALGSLIGALVQYARGKNVLRGAGIGGATGAGAGLLGGLGYQYSKKAPSVSGAEQVGRSLAKVVNTVRDPIVRNQIAYGITGNTPKVVDENGNVSDWGLEPGGPLGNSPESEANLLYQTFGSKAKGFGDSVWKSMLDGNTQNAQRAEQREAENEAAADRATGVEAILNYAQGLQDELNTLDRKASNREMVQGVKNTMPNAWNSVKDTAKKNTQKAQQKAKANKKVREDNGDPDSWINLRPGGYN